MLGLFLFAGGVANVIYAANNAGTIDNMSNLCNHPTDSIADICDTLKTVRDSEAAAGVSWKPSIDAQLSMSQILLHQHS